VLCALLFTASAPAQTKKPSLEFNRDIRPILADHCFACHGPDPGQRKADLRLDTEEGAFADRGGYTVLQRGKPDASELIKRISSAGKKGQMPPPKSPKQLSAAHIAILRQWVEEGANYQKHWSLIKTNRPTLPEIRNPQSTTNNPIDAFIRDRLVREGLQAAPEADRRTLLRRLSFDLLGLPPAPEDVEAFVQDKSPKAYENAVDRLLNSKHYGERMALYWLDVVRFADTAGYHSDNHRDIAPYRDYIIDAFNANKPFNHFVVEQLAGDLLPNATNEQKIASGFNRLLMTTEEGGAQAKEYAAKYASDRVRNTATIFLGLTLGCCECHDHKFDPLTQKDFYRFAAFFADVKEKPVGRQDQDRLPTPAQDAKIKELDGRIAAFQKSLTDTPADFEGKVTKWEESLKGNTKGLPKPVAAVLALEPDKRTPAHKKVLADHYRTIAPELAVIRKQIADVQREKDDLLKNVPSTLVTTSVAPRMVRVLKRGNWLDESGEIVKPGTPGTLAALNFKGERASRLDLGNWLASTDNPLTARVFVNRLWKLFYGQGLVKTLDDFGSQGLPPTHPELLDWLAVEFMQSGWDVKKLVKLMVTTDTYKQSSMVNEKLKHVDPYNLLLARQARFRLDAEMVRDNALAVSGLLVRKIGGPSARPYQPAGYWAMLNFPTREWMNDQGEGLYRRGLYTYWCRTFPHPSLVAFDAPSREECTVERPRSNTPLQALVLLNDPIYVEAARVFAGRMIRGGGKTPAERIQFAYRHALNRKAEPAEEKLLVAVYNKHLEQYRKDPDSARKVLTIGAAPRDQDVDFTELAAATSIARIVLNLHETITRN
jgi:hypothetical protein